MCGGCGEINIVVACSSANYYLQLRCSTEHFSVDLVGANDECVGVFHCLEELSLLSVFLKNGQLVTSLGDYFLDALNGLRGKGLFGCYKYLHII